MIICTINAYLVKYLKKPEYSLCHVPGLALTHGPDLDPPLDGFVGQVLPEG